MAKTNKKLNKKQLGLIEDAKLNGYLVCGYRDFVTQDAWREICFHNRFPCAVIYHNRAWSTIEVDTKNIPFELTDNGSEEVGKLFDKWHKEGAHRVNRNAQSQTGGSSTIVSGILREDAGKYASALTWIIVFNLKHKTIHHIDRLFWCEEFNQWYDTMIRYEGITWDWHSLNIGDFHGTL